MSEEILDDPDHIRWPAQGTDWLRLGVTKTKDILNCPEGQTNQQQSGGHINALYKSRALTLGSFMLFGLNKHLQKIIFTTLYKRKHCHANNLCFLSEMQISNHKIWTVHTGMYDITQKIKIFLCQSCL